MKLLAALLILTGFSDMLHGQQVLVQCSWLDPETIPAGDSPKRVVSVDMNGDSNLDRFLHHSEIITFSGQSFRLRHRNQDSKPATVEKAPTGSTKK